jgi:hypothetical protein
MDGKDLLKLDLGERIVTLARLLAAEHVRQELASTNHPDTTTRAKPVGHVPSLTQLASPDAAPVQQHVYTPSLRKKEAA